MNGSMMRETLLTNNLANANTPGYQPEDVDFQSTLANAISEGKAPTAVTFSPYTEDVSNTQDGNGVDADQTNAEIAENGLLYQDMTQIVAAREGILEAAMNSGGTA